MLNPNHYTRDFSKINTPNKWGIPTYFKVSEFASVKINGKNYKRQIWFINKKIIQARIKRNEMFLVNYPVTCYTPSAYLHGIGLFVVEKPTHLWKSITQSPGENNKYSY